VTLLTAARVPQVPRFRWDEELPADAAEEASGKPAAPPAYL
jgi:hypothetical protein